MKYLLLLALLLPIYTNDSCEHRQRKNTGCPNNLPECNEQAPRTN